MMNEKWEEQFREQIHEFVGTIEKFDKGEIDRKAYKGNLRWIRKLCTA